MGNIHSRYDIIRVRPTLTASSAYADGDVIFDATEIPNAVKGKGGCSKLVAAYMIDESSNATDMAVYFMQESTSFGTRHDTANISDDNLEAAKLCGISKLFDSATKSTELDNMRVHQIMSGGGSDESLSPLMLLQAENDSTSVFFTAVVESGTPTYAATDSLEFIFHIEK